MAVTVGSTIAAEGGSRTFTRAILDAAYPRSVDRQAVFTEVGAAAVTLLRMTRTPHEPFVEELCGRLETHRRITAGTRLDL